MNQPDLYNVGVYQQLALEKNPFKQGTNCCCIAHTSVNRYKQALKKIESSELGYRDCIIVDELNELENAYKDLLNVGYCMAKNFARIYTLELRS